MSKFRFSVGPWNVLTESIDIANELGCDMIVLLMGIT